MAINGIDEKILFQRHNSSKTPNKKGSINPYLTKPEDLLREDNSGVLVIDPNKVVDAYNEIKDRYIKQEDLTVYASLKVFKRANSSVVYNSVDGTRVKDITNEPIYINFLNPITRSNGANVNKNKLTTEWVDFFTSDSANDEYDSGYILDPESFGITNINIKINASHHPIIVIEFTDVQGRVLFERGNQRDNPYNIFYTYPYPKFSLKYKGYFGKSVETSLVLRKSNTRFDPSTGNYNVTAEFESDVFSIFNTFLIIYAYVAPYMFRLENGEYLGRKILTKLYERQNLEIRERVGEDLYPKYEIKNSPSLWDLSGALAKIPSSSLNQSGETDDVIADNNVLLESKRLIENYSTNIIDYFRNTESYKEVIATGENINELVYEPLRSENVISISETTPSDFFEQIQAINKAVKDLSEIENNSVRFKENLTYLIKNNERLKKIYSKVNIDNIIDPNIFLYKKQTNTSFQSQPIYLDLFNLVLSLISEALEKTQAVIENQYITNQIKDLGVTLGYQPNLSNVIRIIANNMQTFLIMLDLMGKSANKQLAVDTLRIEMQNRYSDNIKEFGDTLYSAFPNYFKTVTQFEGTEVINRSVLSYPGADAANKNWFEVRFVEEIYEAITRIQQEANPINRGITQQYQTGILSVFQLGENDLTVYKTKEVSRALAEAFSKYAIYISYSGMIYRGISSFDSNVASVISNFEFDLINTNIVSKIESDSGKWVFLNGLLKATESIVEDNVSYTNLGNYGIKTLGFADKTLSGSLNVLKPLFEELSELVDKQYTQNEYSRVINKFNELFKSPNGLNSSGQKIGLINKTSYDIITYKKSENNIDLYSITRDKKITPIKHLLDLRPNTSYYCDNSALLIDLSNNLTRIDQDKSDKNSFQGLYINMNANLQKIVTSTDISRDVNYETNPNTPALTFNTDSSDYVLMNDLSPFNNIQRSLPSENFYLTYNIL